VETHQSTVGFFYAPLLIIQIPFTTFTLMENTTNTQVENTTDRIAWFNGNNRISIEMENGIIDDFGEFVQIDLITAIRLRNDLNIAINESLETIKELNENN
jgi:hypothetical protein